MVQGMGSRSGPLPDPNALYGSKNMGEWVDLPAGGRLGDPPTWPLPAPTVRELVIWADEWRRPQAVMWERNRQQREVAIYVRQFVVAEQPKAPTAARHLLRQQMEILGLSLPGLLRNRWRIPAVDPDAAADTTAGPESAAFPSTRDRFRVVGDNRSP